MNGFIVLCFSLLFSLTSSALTFDSNVPENIKKQILDDLDFVSSIQGGQISDLHKKIFGTMNGEVYSDFFAGRVKQVGLSSCGNPNAVACVIPSVGASQMWLTPNYIKFSHPQIARLMVVFHEARHTEISHMYWGHAKCPSPFNDPQGNPLTSIWTGAALAGEPACDKTPLGSYGSSLIMLKNISKFCSTCNEKVKMDAGIYADDQFKRIISASAIKEIKNDLYKAKH